MTDLDAIERALAACGGSCEDDEGAPLEQRLARYDARQGAHAWLRDLIAEVRALRACVEAMGPYLDDHDRHHGDDYFATERRRLRMRLDDALEAVADAARGRVR